ncbi:MAG: hypothetical protein KGJ93_04750 [Patescibacteria group bacterium]|nr:hypothetical protein [Patescibacteria group bacterium]
MFGQRKNRDYYARFQGRAFRQRLQQARGYKRKSFADQPAQQQNFKVLLRLAPLWVWLTLFVATLAAVWLIYLPSPLAIKNVSVLGLNPKSSQNAKILLAQFMNQKSLWPQNNWLTFSASKASDYLLKNDSAILKIDFIHKRFPSSLEITAQPRQVKFLISSPNDQFFASNDYLLSSVKTPITSDLIKVNFIANNKLTVGQTYNNLKQLEAIGMLQELLPGLTGQGIDHYEISDYTEPNVAAVTQNNYKIYFDSGADLSVVAQQLGLLLNSIAPQDLKNLAYVDMTVPNRGYVCLKNTVCSATPPDIILTATSTASSTPENQSTTTLP